MLRVAGALFLDEGFQLVLGDLIELEAVVRQVHSFYANLVLQEQFQYLSAVYQCDRKLLRVVSFCNSASGELAGGDEQPGLVSTKRAANVPHNGRANALLSFNLYAGSYSRDTSANQGCPQIDPTVAARLCHSHVRVTQLQQQYSNKPFERDRIHCRNVFPEA